MRHFSMNAKGFSLVELMIAVGIIGVLATLAVPKFQQFQAKAKMTEAKNILVQIQSLEELYYLDKNTYLAGAQLYGRSNCAVPAWATTIGFTITPCSAGATRFDYSVTVASATALQVTASSSVVCPQDGVATVFTIDQNKLIQGTGGNGSNPPTACAQ